MSSIFVGIGGIIYLAIFVVVFAGMWKVFEKAGKPGWAAIIPIYNMIILLEIVGKPTYWIVLFLIPCVNIVFLVWTFNLLSKSFGQSEGFTIGLLLLGVVFIPLLGFGDYQYLGPSAAEAGGMNSVGASSYKNPFDQQNPGNPNPNNPSNRNPHDPNGPQF